jgi:hypothetical protein
MLNIARNHVEFQTMEIGGNAPFCANKINPLAPRILEFQPAFPVAPFLLTSGEPLGKMTFRCIPHKDEAEEDDS